MSYTPIYVSSDDYGEIRIALGYAPDSTEPVSTTVIEARQFLPNQERRFTPVLEEYEIVMDDGDPLYDADIADQVKQAIILFTAGAIAANYLKARQGDRVKQVGTGPHSVTYDTGVDYAQLGKDLDSQALAVMEAVDEDAAWALYNNPFAISEWPDSDLTVLEEAFA